MRTVLCKWLSKGLITLLSANHLTITTLFVQRLRSKHWTYKSKFCLSVFLSFCLSFFHSVSNFLGFLLVKALPIGTSAPTVRSYTLSSTVLASRARVGARVEKKKWFREGFKNFFSWYQIGLKGLSHENLFRHISCKNASEIWWSRWKIEKVHFQL